MARGAIETLGFSGLALPLTFVISVLTTRFLLPDGRGAYVLALLAVDVFVRLIANDGAVINHLSKQLPVRVVVIQALVQDCALGLLGLAVLIPVEIVLTSGSSGQPWVAAFALPFILLARTM